MEHPRLSKFRKNVKKPTLLESTPDLFYMTGLHLSKGRLLVKKGEAILFVDGRYFETAKKAAPCAVEKWEDFKKIDEKEVVFDSSILSYDGYLSLKKLCPKTKWTAKSNPLQDQRAIKEPEEIAALKKAAKLTEAGIQHVSSLLKVDVTEIEMALEFEMFVRKHGASKLSFDPIIAFGEHGAYPHYRPGKVPLKQNQAVLIDAGAVVDAYCGDLTRMVYFQEPNLKVIELEETVRIAQEEAIRMAKPGVKVKELDKLVREIFESRGVKQLYTHSLGHGIGLETHEYPIIRVTGDSSDTVLAEGMVFTIEPGLYQPGLGGVRLEEMVLITKTGCSLLTD